MDPLREFGRTMVLAGIVLALLGAFLASGAKLPFRLGRLPGDIAWQGKNASFYFPIVTCIVLSAVFTTVLWLLGQIKK